MMAEQRTLTGDVTEETGVPGLQRRHVKRIHIEWEDKPPPDIAEQRLRDITTALALGFVRLDQPIDEDIARERAGMPRSRGDEPAPMVTKHTPAFMRKHADGLAGSQED